MLKRISHRGFRNLEATEWEPEAPFQLLLGANGAGKTSLLEAVYLVATTRSFRTARLDECVASGGSDFTLTADVDLSRRSRLEYRWSNASGQRQVNGSSVRLTEYLGVLPIIAWTTASSQIFQGPPHERRKLLDQGIVGIRPSAIEELAGYRRALFQKRKFLVGALMTGASGELTAWNQVLAQSATKVIAARSRFVAELRASFQQIVERERLPYRSLQMAYRPSPANGLEGLEAVTEALARAIPSEQRASRPLLGPHRDEIVFSWEGRDLRRMVSAGERKGIGLALTAARGEVLSKYQKESLFLLDDLDAELDSDHLGIVLRAFTGARQIFATSSRPEIWERVLERASDGLPGALSMLTRSRVEQGTMHSW